MPKYSTNITMKLIKNPLIKFIIVENTDDYATIYTKDGHYVCPRCHEISNTKTCPRCGSKCNRIFR